MPLILTLPLTLAACAEADLVALQTALTGVPPEAPAAEPAPLPPAVAAALPPGTPSTIVFQDPRGCYLFSIEATVPPSGFPVRDAAGNQICEGGAPAPAGGA
jgi:hypothetical protein